MLIWSITEASTAAIAQPTARSRIRAANTSRRGASSNFESRSPRIRSAGFRMTAAATTGPNSDPRPTSSTPAISFAPAIHASFSNLVVHLSVFSRRSLAADLEIGWPFLPRGRGFDLRGSTGEIHLVGYCQSLHRPSLGQQKAADRTDFAATIGPNCTQGEANGEHQQTRSATGCNLATQSFDVLSEVC